MRRRLGRSSLTDPSMFRPQGRSESAIEHGEVIARDFRRRDSGQPREAGGAHGDPVRCARPPRPRNPMMQRPSSPALLFGLFAAASGPVALFIPSIELQIVLFLAMPVLGVLAVISYLVQAEKRSGAAIVGLVLGALSIAVPVCILVA